tara:strand:+ start:1238 stop:1471 length:234 start_codon:yes stop_codon:yes gene_type:complete
MTITECQDFRTELERFDILTLYFTPEIHFNKIWKFHIILKATEKNDFSGYIVLTKVSDVNSFLTGYNTLKLIIAHPE